MTDSTDDLTRAQSAAPPVPTVSVVIIFLDGERFLREAIESVFAQSYDGWELVLVDDGSTDRSAAIAEEFVARDPGRVRYVTHPDRANHGMSASRNLGIASGRGELLAFLDADDVWLPFKLAHQVALLERHPDVDMVYGPTEYWFSWTGVEADRDRDMLGRLAIVPGRPIDPPELLVRALETQGGMLPGICSLVVRRGAIERFGAFEESFRGSYEDQVFFARMFRNVRILVTDRCSDRYRQHDGSCCAIAQTTGEYDPEGPHPAKRRFLEWLDDYLRARPLASGDPLAVRLERALAREWLPYRSPGRHRAQELVRRSRRLPRRLAGAVKKRLPARLRRAVAARVREGRFVPPVGWVRLGSLGRLAPVSRDFGFDRGLPIDRYHIEAFLQRHASDVRGRVLEVGGDEYTRRFGGDAVTKSDVLDVSSDMDGAAIVGDLADAPQLEEDAYDCVIVTQTLQYVYDLRASVATLHRILRPGGVILATAPGVTQIVDCPWRSKWFWSLTDASALALFTERFPQELVRVSTPGNVVSTTAFLQGLATGDLSRRALDHDDPDYQLIVTVRAEKPTQGYLESMAGRWDYSGRRRDAYGEDTSYRIGIEFLDLPGAILEDWGCGLTYARRFVENATYVGVDGSVSRWTDRVVDLRTYRSDVDCVFVRHVLEHNPDWQTVLDNALASFRRRMALIVFTPLAEETREIAQWSGIPDIAFAREDLVSRFPTDVRVEELHVETDTQYGGEHVFLLERVG